MIGTVEDTRDTGSRAMADNPSPEARFRAAEGLSFPALAGPPSAGFLPRVTALLGRFLPELAGVASCRSRLFQGRSAHLGHHLRGPP